jgi:hypothetical protein
VALTLWVENARAAACLGVLIASIVVLVRSVRRRALSIKDGPNAVIVSSLRASLLAAAGFGVLVTCIFSFAYGLLYGLVVGLNLGLWMGLWYGGGSVISHYTLRVLLHLEGQTEYASPALFEAAADRLLLRRVGRGFMFIHQTFQDYLAR